MPKYITPFEIADCNKALTDAGLPGRIRLHDACGGQSLSYEGADGLTADIIPAEIQSQIEAQLTAKGYKPIFDDRSGYFRIE